MAATSPPDAVKDAVEAIAQNPDKSVFPLSLLLLVLAFLAIQNRIDRSDPKLALAPTFADPDLEFRPSPGDDRMSTAATTANAAASELVPIADRLRYLQAFRFLLAARRRARRAASSATT